MSLYPEIEPYAHGMLNVGDGHLIYWECCGNSDGKPAVVLHGGPGSGCTPWHRRLFDPEVYKVVLFDQRNCGRSTPHASFLETDLSANTTPHLAEDIERLRRHLNIEKWLVLGGSWGSVLALAYAERFAGRISEMVLFGVATGRHSELDWLFRGGLSALFPVEWQRLKSYAGTKDDWEVVERMRKLLNGPQRFEAATEWCLWESATPHWPLGTELSPRFQDPDYAVAFARLVTHYVCHDTWLPEEGLPSSSEVLGAIPGVIVNGRMDFQSPLGNAWHLLNRWPGAEVRVVDNAGHAGSHEGITKELVSALDRFTNKGD